MRAHVFLPVVAIFSARLVWASDVLSVSGRSWVDAAGSQTLISALPASGSVKGTSDIGSTATTNYKLDEATLRFTFQHLLSGSVGSSITSDSTFGFTTAYPLLYSMSGNYSVTQPLWTSAPPQLSINALLGQSNGYLTFAAPHGSSNDGSSLSISSAGLPIEGEILEPGQRYEAAFSAAMQASAAGSAAKAQGSMTFHFSLWGDFNDSGSVGFDDLVDMATHYGVNGASATYANGDMNNDSNIGFDDLIQLAAHYGESFPQGTAAITLVAVPEPCFLACLPLVGLVMRRRRTGRINRRRSF